MKSAFWVVLAVFCVYADMTQLSNWNGYKDTVSIRDLTGTSTKYSRMLNLSGYEDIRAVIMVNDTGAAGFASDSVKIEWGYQTGNLVMDSLAIAAGTIIDSTIDTSWDDRIVLDTVDVDSFGVSHNGYVGADGSMTRYLGSVDTSNVTGFATQSRWFVPEWDVGLRYWATGLTGNSAGDSLTIFIDTKRRLHSRTQ